MSYIVSPLEEMLMENTDVSSTYSPELNHISEGLLDTLDYSKDIKPQGPIITKSGISEKELVDVYLEKLTHCYDRLMLGLSEILNSEEYSSISKSFVIESEEKISSDLKYSLSNLGESLTLKFMTINLYKLIWNPHCMSSSEREVYSQLEELHGKLVQTMESILTDNNLFFITTKKYRSEWTLGITLNKHINLTPVVVNESHMKIKPNKVKQGQPGFYLHGTYYAIRWIDGKPYRDRVENLVIKDGNKVFLRMSNDNPQFPYTIPGGGLDLDSEPIEQARNETREEALFDVKGIKPTGIIFTTVYKDDSKSKFKHIEDFPIRYRGSFTEVFVSEYDRPISKDDIEEKDLDPKMANEGKFIEIRTVIGILSKEHKQALINSSYIDQETRNLLMIQELVTESAIIGYDTCLNLYNQKVDDIYSSLVENNDDLESKIYNHKVRFMELNKFVKEYVQKGEEYSNLLNLFQLHINKQLSSVRFAYKSNHDKDIKDNWLEFDKWLVDMKTKLQGLLIRPTVESTHSIKVLNKLYHISPTNLDNRVLLPKRPDNFMTNNGFEDNTTMRVCFSTSVDGALTAMSRNLKGETLYVHEPQRKPNSIQVPTQEQVPDVIHTDEVWVTNPVKVECVGKLKVIDSYDTPLLYKYGTAEAETYRWVYEWINAPEGVIKETTIFESSMSLTIVMEADPMDEEDEVTDYTETDEEEVDVESEEDEPTDYTEEEEPAEEDEMGDTEEVDVEEEPTDYTEEEDETVDDTQDDVESEEDTDTTEEEPTDYTDTETTDDGEGGEEEDTTQDEETTTEEETNDGEVKYKNKALLKDFNKLFFMVDEIITNLESQVFIDPVQNSGLSQVLKNLNKIKDYIVNYIQNHFDLTSYTSNLYYYNIALQSLKINYKMLEKIQELDGNNKQIDKNK